MGQHPDLCQQDVLPHVKKYHEAQGFRMTDTNVQGSNRGQTLLFREQGESHFDFLAPRHDHRFVKTPTSKSTWTETRHSGEYKLGEFVCNTDLQTALLCGALAMLP